MDRRNDPRALTVGELVRSFLAHAESYYRDAEGKPTREHLNFHSALFHNLMFTVDADLPLVHFTKQDLRRVQSDMVQLKRSRSYINATMRRIRAMFKWAVEQDLIEDTEGDALASRLLGMFAAVQALKPHRSQAYEPPKVQPVAVEHVLATLREMTGSARDVVELLLRTGARTQEIAGLRAGDVRRDPDGQWAAHPRKHKNAWRRQELAIPLDASCMRIIHRRTVRGLFGNVLHSEILFPNQHGRCYTTNGLRSAILRAIDKANRRGVHVPHWHLHQTRHTVAQLARALSSLDDAQALLGHKSRKMTELYTGPVASSEARRAQRRISRVLKGVA